MRPSWGPVEAQVVIKVQTVKVMDDFKALQPRATFLYWQIYANRKHYIPSTFYCIIIVPKNYDNSNETKVLICGIECVMGTKEW